MKEETPDFIGSGLLVALGAAFALGSLQYGVIEGGRIGPGFMPFLSGVLLAFFGTLIAVEAAVRRVRRRERPAGVTEISRGRQEVPSGPVATVFGLTLVAILLIPVLGFFLSFGLLIAVLVAFVEREGWRLGLTMGVGGAVFAWLVFAQLLNIPVPRGIFETLMRM
jgi:putative tricarboxylic transport membrane protein